MWRARLLLLAALIGVPMSLAGCTTFGRISWRNALIVLRQPDRLPQRVTAPRRAEARLAALWIGHASMLVQMDDKFILTDPVFTRYVGGVSARLVEPGIHAADLPAIDAVLVSHRHFDHLSSASLSMIGARAAAVLVPPQAAQDIPRGPYLVAELAPWHSWQRDGLCVTAVPVLHSGGRLPGDEGAHARAYTAFVIEYRGLVVFFAGDTAYDAALFQGIAARYPRIDLALLPIGPINPPDEMLPHHMNPSQALDAGRILRAAHIVPMHFATFINSLDGPGEVEAGLARARSADGIKAPPVTLLGIGEQRVFLLK